MNYSSVSRSLIISTLFYFRHVGCDCDEDWTGEYCEYKFDQIMTSGIATRIFLGFMFALIAILLSLAGIFYWRKIEKNDRSTYETAPKDDVHVNPNGDDNDEYQKVTII